MAVSESASQANTQSVYIVRTNFTPTPVVSLLPGLPSPTIARAVSSKLLGF